MRTVVSSAPQRASPAQRRGPSGVKSWLVDTPGIDEVAGAGAEAGALGVGHVDPERLAGEESGGEEGDKAGLLSIRLAARAGLKNCEPLAGAGGGIVAEHLYLIRACSVIG